MIIESLLIRSIFIFSSFKNVGFLKVKNKKTVTIIKFKKVINKILRKTLKFFTYLQLIS